jgi:hypothetical protein
LDAQTLKNLVASCSSKLHADDPIGCAAQIADAFEVSFSVRPDADPVLALPILRTFQQHLLDNRQLFLAARMAWPVELFDYRPKFTQDIFRLLDTRTMVLLQGAASCSKSYTAAVWMLLEWWADPDWTTVKVLGPSEDHLEQNLFSHMVALHGSSRIPMPGECGDLFIGENRRNQLGSINGVAVPVGRMKRAGRLVGVKRKTRVGGIGASGKRVEGPHPIYGTMSRLIFFLEEGERIQPGIWGDVNNVLSNVDHTQKYALRIVAAYNPEDVTSPVAQRAEPAKGWKYFDLEGDTEWVSKRGWTVLRLDGEKSENVIAGQRLYEGLQTREGLASIAANSGGTDSPGYMTMGRGAYPALGTVSSVVKAGRVAAGTATPIWQGKPENAAGVDAALTGGAGCVMTYGRYGMAVGALFPPSNKHPGGVRVMFKDKSTGVVKPRLVAVVDGQLTIPSGDSMDVAKAIRARGIEHKIKPEDMAFDVTGNGTGPADILRHTWGAIARVNYSESPTEIPLSAEGAPAKTLFHRICCELYFAIDAWLEYGCLFFSPQFNTDLVEVQLTDRRWRPSNGQRRVEGKDDYKKRHEEHSPDEADSLSLFLHAVRIRTRYTPSATGKGTAAPALGNDEATPIGDEDWPMNMEEAGGSRFFCAPRRVG